jgi:hypothetical protein
MKSLTLRVVVLALIFSLVLLRALQTAAKSDFTTTPYATKVVAKKRVVGQVGQFPKFTLYTPAADGNYRISFYLECQTPVPSGNSILISKSWTDDYAARVDIGGTFAQDGATYNWVTDVMHVKAGTPITIDSNGTTDTTTTYSVFIALEKL